MLATRQHGVVTAAQLRKLGLTHQGMSKRTEAGTLHRIHRGVYAVGHPRLAEKGLWMAAVLAAGERAVLASLSAAVLWRISRWTPDEIFVLAPGKHRPRNDFRLQTCRHLDRRDVTWRHGIPVTTVARTLVDLTDVLTAPQIANVIHEAAFRKRFNEAGTRAAMARANGRANLARLENALTLNARGSAGTKSELEDRFLAHVREAGLPEPEINVKVEGLEVDFRLGRRVFEVDGAGHERPRPHAEDEQRDAPLRAAGYDVVRVSTSSRRSSFPAALRGSASTTEIDLGTLNAGSRSRQNARRSSTGPRATTNALTASPHSASGRPKTPASTTAGCSSSTASTSVGATFSPPVTIMSDLRPTTISRAPSMRPRSPVRRTPPPATVGPETRISPSGAIETRNPGSGAPELSTSPGSATVTAEHACVSTYAGATGHPASRARVSSVRSAGAPPSMTTRNDGGGGVPAESRRASWVGTSEAIVMSSRQESSTAVVPAITDRSRTISPPTCESGSGQSQRSERE